MLNKNNERMLAYIVTVDEIRPLEGYDKVEYARTSGWWCIVNKGQFKVGDNAIYFEVDSLCPKKDERFAFLEKRNYCVKTLKMCKVISQGLLLPMSCFPEVKDKGLYEDVTKILGVTYYEPSDNERKSKNGNKNAKYNNMAARHPKLVKKSWFKWMMKRLWGRKVLFLFLGNKKDSPKKFPNWIKRTDEDRIENCVWLLDIKEPFAVTEKIDGTSTTFFLDTTKRKHEFGVCSRNVRQMDVSQENYHTETNGLDNVYWEMAFKYDIENVLEKIAEKYDIKRVVLQGETYGEKLQGNPYRLNERRFAAFNLIFDGIRLGSVRAKNILRDYDVPFVPILDECYTMPDDFEELKLSADGKSVINSECRREGFVYRSQDGNISAKNISREFLLSRKD